MRLLICILAAALIVAAPAERALATDINLTIKLGPIARTSTQNKVIGMTSSRFQTAELYDIQDNSKHKVRGTSLARIVRLAKPPKRADTAVLEFKNGMRIAVDLRNKRDVAAVFVAFEHGNELNQYSTTYALSGERNVPCPKVVHQRPTKGYSVWRYATTPLTAVRFVTRSVYQALLAQPTRRKASGKGWRLYERYCQSCHSFGKPGAKRGPNFVSGISSAYRRIPPMKSTVEGQPPSLHEKIHGTAGGKMPSLNQIPNKDIATLWRWLHVVYKGATK